MTGESWLRIKNLLWALHKTANSHLKNQVLNVLEDSSCHFFTWPTLNETLWAFLAGWALISPGRPAPQREGGRACLLVSSHGGGKRNQPIHIQYLSSPSTFHKGFKVAPNINIMWEIHYQRKVRHRENKVWTIVRPRVRCTHRNA